MTISFEQAASKIMVALDYPSATEAEQLIKKIDGIPCYIKVGMQLFYAAGPSFVEGLKNRGFKVFLDLKMHDIPNTVKGGANSITKLGVDMFNVHAAGGKLMMEAAMEGVYAAASNVQRPTVIAVTQLTSTSQLVMNEEIGIAGTVEQAVIRYAKLTKQAGLDGVVASPSEVIAIKEACGQTFQTITPGIRPSGSELNDQTRIMTPSDALKQGTDYMVIGRPITAAKDARLSLESIIKELVNYE